MPVAAARQMDLFSDFLASVAGMQAAENANTMIVDMTTGAGIVVEAKPYRPTNCMAIVQACWSVASGMGKGAAARRKRFLAGDVTDHEAERIIYRACEIRASWPNHDGSSAPLIWNNEEIEA